MQAVEIQRTQRIRSLEGKLEEKVQELKETCQQVSYNHKCNDFATVIVQLLHLLKMEDNLQAKDKQISRLEASLEEKQTKQAEKRSSDATTQFVYSDVVECKSETIRTRI